MNLSACSVLPDVSVGVVSGLVVVALLYALHCVVQLARFGGQQSEAVTLYLAEVAERESAAPVPGQSP